MPTAPYAGQSAVDRALGWVGKSYGVGWCQKFTNEIFQTGSVGDWDADGAADAEDGWKKAVAKGKVVRAADIHSLKDIPAAVMLYWTGGSSDHGHAAVGVGGGKMVSTDLPTSGRVGKVPIGMAHDRWGLTFMGFVTTEGNGYDLGSFMPGKLPGGLYKVNTKAGLHARKAPAGDNVMRNGQKLVRPYGFTLRVVGTQNGSDGASWSNGSGGYWYASRYLKKK